MTVYLPEQIIGLVPVSSEPSAAGNIVLREVASFLYREDFVQFACINPTVTSSLHLPIVQTIEKAVKATRGFLVDTQLEKSDAVLIESGADPIYNAEILKKATKAYEMENRALVIAFNAIFVRNNFVTPAIAGDTEEEQAISIRQWIQDNPNNPVFNLTDINLSSLDLKVVPMELLSLFTNLQKLNLLNNNIHFLPPNIRSLINLHTLCLVHNQLETLPASIGSLEHLQHLFVSNNRLEALPVEIGNLRELQELDVSYNSLEHLPNEIGNLRELRRLDVSHNSLVGNLGELEILDVSKNRLWFQLQRLLGRSCSVLI